MQANLKWLYKYLPVQTFNKLFLFGLLIKLVVGALASSQVLNDWFLPFVEYFLRSGFKNPYQHFFMSNSFEAFPYPPLMLWLISLPSALFHVLGLDALWAMNPIKLLAIKLPLLVADVCIYCLLCFLLPTRQRKVLTYYWLSPIVFYICYVHGQLDILPTAFFLAAIIFLAHGKSLTAHLLLGFGLATKTHLFAALPFIFLYSYFRDRNFKRSLGHICVPLLLFALFQIPYWGEGYYRLVFLEEQKLRLLAVYFPYNLHDLQFLFAPAVLLFIFFKFASMQSTHRDSLMLFMGMLYGAMVSVVPPMPGWFMWSFPFFCYFFVKYNETPRFSFLMYSLFFVIYFLLESNVNELTTWVGAMSPALRDGQTLHDFLLSNGLNAKLYRNLSFTILEVSFVMNVIWIYRMGLSSSSTYRRMKSGVTVGICGDSGAGKNFQTKTLISLLGSANTVVIEGDDLHKWERGHENWQTVSHLDPRANFLQTDVQHAQSLSDGISIKRAAYEHGSGKFSKPKLLQTNRFVIFQGLHTFFLPRMRGLLDLKLFVRPEKNLRYFWKIKRDMEERHYSLDQVIKQLNIREQDSKNFIDTQSKHADIMVEFFTVPANLSLEQMLAGESFNVKLRCGLRFDFDVEKLLAGFRGIDALQVACWYEPEAERVYVEFLGAIDAAGIEAVAANLIPDYADVVENFPVWEKGYQGIVQIIVLLFLHDHFRAEKKSLSVRSK